MNQKNLDALNAMQPQSVDDLNLVEVLDVARVGRLAKLVVHVLLARLLRPRARVDSVEGFRPHSVGPLDKHLVRWLSLERLELRAADEGFVELVSVAGLCPAGVGGCGRVTRWVETAVAELRKAIHVHHTTP